MSNTNSLDMVFLVSIIRPYYNSCTGKLTLINAFIHQNKWINAEILYKQLITDFRKTPKTLFFIKELFGISNRFDVNKYSNFNKKILREYFKLDKKSCLNEILHTKKINNLFCIFDLFVGWFFSRSIVNLFYITKRIFGILKKYFLRSLFKNYL